MYTSKYAVLLATALIVSCGEQVVELRTKLGVARGLTQNTVVGIQVDTFLGIPYGVSPSGINRFAPPKAAKPWGDVLDATRAAKPCHQVILDDWKETNVASSDEATEDCLNLDVWVPNPRPTKTAVMVFIHGGGYSCGSGHLPLYDGAVLAAQENVIVVTINYRLSAFGFLYLAHPLAPGNVGLMDQALALQWVKENIDAFGGDAERVTIFGESAGSASVGLHLLLPTSLDLFKNAILQSGSPESIWATYDRKEALETTLLLAKNAGCPTDRNSMEDTIRCLQEMNVKDLLKAMLTVEDTPMKLKFRPVVDGQYLPRTPSELLDNGKFCTEKNVQIGYTREDGAFIFLLAGLKLTDDMFFTQEQKRDLFSRLSVMYQEVSGVKLDLLEHLYTNWSKHSEDKFEARNQIVQFLTDRWFTCTSLSTADKLSDKGNNVYIYRFDHIRDTVKTFVKVPRWVGSSHGEELGFVFGNVLKEEEGLRNEDAKLSKVIMRYWANFARNGDPNEDYLVTWPKYTSQEKVMIKLDGESITTGRNDRVKECQFWQNIFPKIVDNYSNEVL